MQCSSVKIHINSLLAHRGINSKSVLFHLEKKKKSSAMEWLVGDPLLNETAEEVFVWAIIFDVLLKTCVSFFLQTSKYMLNISE